MPKLIGLHGWGGSGKDAAAQFLVEQGWERRAFADPLRDLALAADPIVSVDKKWIFDDGTDNENEVDGWRYSDSIKYYGYDEAKNHDDFRGFLQRLGDGARATFGANFWVEQATARIFTDTVWTDVRYSNEGQAIRDLGGMVIKIERPGVGPANDFEAKEHSMEGFDFDVELMNSGTLDDLRSTILTIAEDA